MIRCRRLIGIAALMFALVAGSGRGQELRQLKESDIHKLIPLLRAEAAGLVAIQARHEREEAARTGFSGDPLEFLRKRAPLDLPQGARYMESCSRAASVQAARGPSAIFTFGRSIDCYNRTWRDWKRTMRRGQEEKLEQPKISQDCTIEGLQTKEFLKGVRAELEKRGFKFLSEGALGEPYLISADGIFEVELQPYNIYDRAESPDTHPLIVIESEQAREAAVAACSGMPTGPILVVRTGERFFEKDSTATLEAALQKSGLSEKEYDDMKTALAMARLDTKPEWWAAAETAPASDAAAQRDLAIRRNNRSLYRKFAAQLDPLFDALERR